MDEQRDDELIETTEMSMSTIETRKTKTAKKATNYDGDYNDD